MCLCVCVCVRAYRGCQKFTNTLRKGKLYYICNIQFIPVTKDEYKSRLTSAVTRSGQRGYHQRLDTSDYGRTAAWATLTKVSTCTAANAFSISSRITANVASFFLRYTIGRSQGMLSQGNMGGGNSTALFVLSIVMANSHGGKNPPSRRQCGRAPATRC